MYRHLIIFLIIVFTLSACTPKPTFLPPELRIDSKISSPLAIDENVLSTEPTIFVRAMSYDANGAKDLDSLIEKRLESSKHRLVTRSDTASIKLLAQLVYLGSADQIDISTILAMGYGNPIVSARSNQVQNHIYESVAIVDVKTTVSVGADVNNQFCRILIGSRRPMPEMSDQEVRSALLVKAADQISVFFEY